MFLELQRIQLKDACLQLEIEFLSVKGSSEELLESTIVRLQTLGSSFVIGKCWGLRVDPAGYLVLRLNKTLTVSLLVKELDLNLAIAEVLNIRK